jgi:hypothetical protein
MGQRSYQEKAGRTNLPGVGVEMKEKLGILDAIRMIIGLIAIVIIGMAIGIMVMAF